MINGVLCCILKTRMRIPEHKSRTVPTYLYQRTTPLVYADEVVLGSTRRDHVERKIKELRTAVEERGLKISRNNTEYLGTTNAKTQKSIYWERLK